MALRNEDGSLRRHIPRATAQRGEIKSKAEAGVSGCGGELFRSRAAATGSRDATLAVPSRVPDWRHLLDMRENYFYDIASVRTPRRDKGKKPLKL